MFLELPACWLLVRETYCILFFFLWKLNLLILIVKMIFIHETCCVLIVVHRTCFVLIFCLWNLWLVHFTLRENLYIDFSPREADFCFRACCMLIFVCGTCCMLILLMKIVAYWFFSCVTCTLICFLVKLILFIELVVDYVRFRGLYQVWWNVRLTYTWYVSLIYVKWHVI